MHKLLLLSDQSHHAEALCRVFRTLQFEVAEGLEKGGNLPPVYTLAVLELHPGRMAGMLADLRRRNVASKLLALVPLDAGGMEAKLAGLGADDVLAFPVSRARLELTVRNLLRVHVLERAASAAYRTAG